MWHKGFLFVCAVVFALAVVEVGLRAFVPLHFAARAASRYDLDPDLIYRMKPHTSVSWTSDDFTEVSHTNALGLRGPEVGAKRAGEVRILALGDSFTYGHGVQDAEAYPAVLETLLRERGHDVSVLNAGVPGYSTDQSYAYFVRAGMELAPDLVVLGIHCSDVSDNYESPLYDVADGRLLALGARATRLYRFGTLLRSTPAALQRSRVFALVLATLDAHHPKGTPPDVADLAAWSREKIRLEIDDMLTRGQPGRMELAVVLMPCKTGREQYGDLAERLTRSDVAVLDSTAAIAAQGARVDELFFRTDPHLTAAGNRALASVVAAFLEDRGLASR